MSEPIPFDEHAERLKIRSSPKPVTRINRKVLMVGAGLGVLALFAAMSIALKPPTAVDPDQQRELYNTTNKRTPDGLGALPASYSDIAPVEDPYHPARTAAVRRSWCDHAPRRTRTRH